MKIASIADVKARLSAYVKATARGPVVITKNGKPAAVLLAAGDEEELERLVMAYSPKLQSILNAAHDRIRQGAGIHHEDFWAQVETIKPGKRPARPNGARPEKATPRRRREDTNRL
jgi:prevent-host-death family protein